METRDIIVIGASTGGVQVLLDLVRTLPAEFPGAIFIVQHLAPYYKSQLDTILTKEGPLEAVFAKDGEVIKKARIYIAPPDYHLLLGEEQMVVRKGPKENRFRPSIDALFRSAAYTYGPRVIGVVLSGALDDGTSGLWTIKRLGGMAIVQDPADALCSSMPESVLRDVEVDYILPAEQIGPMLVKLTNQPAPIDPELTPREEILLKKEIEIVSKNKILEMDIQNIGAPTLFTCPECHGTLTRLKEGPITRFRCHTGHAYSTSALLAEVSKAVEENFYNVLRALDETILLLEEAGKQHEEKGEKEIAARFYIKAQEIRQRGHRVREAIEDQEQISEEWFLVGKNKT